MFAFSFRVQDQCTHRRKIWQRPRPFQRHFFIGMMQFRVPLVLGHARPAYFFAPMANIYFFVANLARLKPTIPSLEPLRLSNLSAVIFAATSFRYFTASSHFLLF
jgi:hypothetical protein